MEMIMNNDDILKEIIELTTPPGRQPGDITVKDFMAATGLTETSARRRLTKLVQDYPDAWETLKVREGNRAFRVWRKK